MHNFTKINDPMAAEAKSDTNEWVEHLSTILTPKELCTQNNRWAIYITGHGTQKETGFKCCTAGLSEMHMATLLHFFHAYITTDIVAIQSCFTDASRLLNFGQKYNRTPYFDYSIFSTIANNTDPSFSIGPNYIHTYYPPWYKTDHHFITARYYLIQNLLKKMQNIIQKNNQNNESLSKAGND